MRLLIVFLILLAVQAFAIETKFIYNGFQGSINKLKLDGFASILPNGLLRVGKTYDDHTNPVSSAFYPHPVLFRPNHLSFSTTYVFAANSLDSYPYPDSKGIVFGIADSLEEGYLAWCPFPIHVFSVTVQKYSVEIYVKRDKYDTISVVASASASYYSDKEGVNKQLILSSGKPILIWIDYDEVELLLNVTLAPFRHPKPSRSLLSKQLNLSTTLINASYIGFSYCTDYDHLNDRYLLGWSWNQNGKAEELDPSKLPPLPRLKHKLRNQLLVLLAVLLFLFMIVVSGLVFWKKKYNDFPEPWEKEFESQKYSYKDLCVATNGFGNSEVLGVGGFGKVYKGVLPSTNVHVAVKRISHNSKQGMKEFVAEITSMRRLSHRNLVKLLGYCRKNAELLLVYEYMPNGSLDRFLFSQDKKLVLSWCLRFKIIKGVASAVLYLHDEGKQVVLHRDIKASNVLLDADMNSRLSDFGLARFHDHNIDPRITHVVGTIGYIAPEMSRTRTPTTCSDVYAFGMFLLEVCCGRRPIDRHAQCDNESECLFLSDWVYNSWKSGEICKVSDPRMGGDYEEKEIELVLKLGLLCLHPLAEKRPTMNKVVQFLDEGTTDLIPDLPSDYHIESYSYFWEGWRNTQALPASCGTVAAGVLSSTNSALHYGR